MVVKFIVANGRVIFGSKHYKEDYHSNIAEAHGISRSSVRGGGIADLSARKIYGKSIGFGPYDPTEISRILPDWQIDPPSDYKELHF